MGDFRNLFDHDDRPIPVADTAGDLVGWIGGKREMQPDLDPHNIAAGSLEFLLGRQRWLIGVSREFEDGQDVLVVWANRRRRSRLSLQVIPPEWCGYPVVIREWVDGVLRADGRAYPRLASGPAPRDGREGTEASRGYLDGGPTGPSPDGPPDRFGAGRGAPARRGITTRSGGTMTAIRDFHLGDILTVTTGMLVSPRHVYGVYDLLNFMTGDDIYTHQIPRVMKECGPWLIRQHPRLGGPDMDAEMRRLDALLGDDPGKEEAEAIVGAWLGRLVTRFGETLPVEPIPADDHDRIDPIAEAERMAPGRVVIIAKDEGGTVDV
jgi:hypothetical protein